MSKQLSSGSVLVVFSGHGKSIYNRAYLLNDYKYSVILFAHS